MPIVVKSRIAFVPDNDFGYASVKRGGDEVNGMRRVSRTMQIACILILSLIGWSAQPGHAAPSANGFSEVYRLPDGTFAVICSESGRHDSGMQGIHCDHCVLAGPVALPSPETFHWLPLRRWQSAERVLPRKQASDTLPIDRATSRGPPSPARDNTSTIDA